MNRLRYLLIPLSIMLIAVFLSAGCDRKTETPEDEEQITPRDTLVEPEEKTDTASMEEQKVPELTGEWTGQFGDRKMTLNITSQDGNTFEGETVVRWDSPKREKVTGEVNFDTREMTITETAGTRNNGVYRGTVTADMNKFIGVWKDNGNRLTYNVTLTKQ